MTDKTQEYLASAVEPPSLLLPTAFQDHCQVLNKISSKKGRNKEGEHIICVESQVGLESKCSSS